jgi:hypothetical protein
MERQRLDASAEHRANGDWYLHSSASFLVEVGQVIYQLAPGIVHEAQELHFENRLVARDGHADRHAHQPVFRQRRIDDPVFAKFLEEVFGGTEHPSHRADVVADELHAFVALQFMA